MNILCVTPTLDRKIDAGLAKTLRSIERKGDHLLDYYYPMSSLLTWSRNMGVRYCLDNKYDALLFLDSDIEIEDEDFIDKLIKTAYKFNSKIAGGSYRMKRPDINEVVYVAGEHTPQGKRNFSELKEERLCDFCGTGVMLIWREVLEKVLAPWFEIKDLPDGKTIPEDYLFCEKAKGLGFNVSITPIKSKHWGQFAWQT
jgi:glycosyltransferase involved in cell wall biosynthesis